MKALLTKAQGLTLVELLVAMVLSIILSSAMIGLFITHKNTYQLSGDVALMQESARFSLDRIAEDIRSASYAGCTSMASSVVLNRIASPSVWFRPERGVEGWESSNVNTKYGNFTASTSTSSDIATDWVTSSSAQIGDNNISSVENSDIIRIWHPVGDEVLGSISGTTFTPSDAPTYGVNDVVMMSKCGAVDILRPCSVAANSVSWAGCSNNNNTGANAQTLNEAHSGVLTDELVGTVYYVGRRAADSSPSLYRRRSSGVDVGNVEELVEGVASMQIRYGVGNGNGSDVTRYVHADEVGDWSDVVSVDIELLVQGDKEVLDSDQPLTFNGASITNASGRLYRTYSSTIMLRNRQTLAQ